MSNTTNPHTVPDLFQIDKVRWLDGARKVAYDLLKRRSTITIEDVLELYPLPKYLHRNTIGKVFQNEWFQHVGYTSSKRRISHGRTIRLWSISDEFAETLTMDFGV